MNPAFLILFLISWFSGGFNTVSRVNEYAQRAATAYARQEYIEAIVAYEYLLQDLGVRDDQLQLNLAHAYFQAAQWAKAVASYQVLAEHPSNHLRAVAHLQLGNVAVKQKKYRQALALYKAALIAEPVNNAARYNFELLKKYLAMHPEAEDNATSNAPNNATTEADTPPPAAEEMEPQAKKNPDESGEQEAETEQPEPADSGQKQQAPANKNDTPEGDKEREQQTGTNPGDVSGLNEESQADKAAQLPENKTNTNADSDPRAQTRRMRLQQANMSPEKAKLLLDAMRNAELQYIQQLPKKSSRKPDPSKPDW
ncbi:aerotolerance protein [Pontibacter sp. CAU 1760]